MKIEIRRDDPAKGIYNDREKTPEEAYFNRALFKMMFAKLKGEIAKASVHNNDNAIS